MTDARLSKLPKWAQDEIALLRRQRDDARAEIHEVLGGLMPSDTGYYRMEGHSDGGPTMVWLPNRAAVLFFLDGDHAESYVSRACIEAQVMHDNSGPFLSVRSIRDVLEVRPQSANTIQVREAKR